MRAIEKGRNLVYTTSTQLNQHERAVASGDDGLREAINWAMFGRGLVEPSGKVVRRDAGRELVRRIYSNIHW